MFSRSLSLSLSLSLPLSLFLSFSLPLSANLSIYLFRNQSTVSLTEAFNINGVYVFSGYYAHYFKHVVLIII